MENTKNTTTTTAQLKGESQAGKFGDFERRGSTYLLKHYKPTGEVKFIGYSKPTDRPEAYKYDKVMLMRSMLQRVLVRNNYLKKNIRTELYFIVDHDRPQDDVLLCTFHEYKWQASPEVMLDQNWQEIKAVFEEVYAKPEPIKPLSFAPRTKPPTSKQSNAKSQDELLNPNQHFASLESLIAYCNALIEHHCIPRELALNFYRKITENQNLK